MWKEQLIEKHKLNDSLYLINNFTNLQYHFFVFPYLLKALM